MTDLLSSVIAAHGGLDRWHTVRAIDVTQKGDVLANDRTYAMWAACDCGTCVVEAKQAPMVRFNCHCTICQAFTGDAYSDMMVVPASRAVVKTKTGSNYQKYKKFRFPPPNLKSRSLQKVRKALHRNVGLRTGPRPLVRTGCQVRAAGTASGTGNAHVL